MALMTDKTIKELADELHVSKQTIQYHVKSLPTNYTTKNNKNIIMINTQGQSYIKGKLRKKSDKQNSKEPDKETTNYTAKENHSLVQQLEVKDNQIAELQKLLHAQQKLIDQQQILTLQANKKIEQLEYQSEEKEEPISQTETLEKKSWFSKLFK